MEAGTGTSEAGTSEAGTSEAGTSANAVAVAVASENSFENISTLEYLTNPAYYSIIYKTKNKNNKNNSREVNKEELRFYRKRIIALTKDMFKDTVPSRGIKEAHDEYVSILIKYFKSVDKTDIIQEQYNNNDNDNNNNDNDNNDNDNNNDNDKYTQGSGGSAPNNTRGSGGSAPNNTRGSGGSAPNDTQGPGGSAPNNTRGSGGSAPNELIMRKPHVDSTLNNFIIKTTTNQETRIIPIKLEVDLNSPSLKTKGIKPKKIKKIKE